jgi:uncharacterized protein with NRDE domain
VCTIVVLHRTHPEHPLVVAANRDELYAREALSPRPLDEDPRVVAGVDCEHGGTWMGVHASGLFVGLTNQRTWHFGERAPRSRGEVALDALRTGSPEGVRAVLASIDPREYRSFNLIYGDAGGVEVAYARRDRAEVSVDALAPGLHVLANDRMGSPHFPKSRRAAELAGAAGVGPWPETVSALRAMLADHELPAIDSVPAPPADADVTHALARELQAVCIHTPFYGTRSSTILALDHGRVARYLFADGSPCRAPHVDITHLLDTPHPS